MPGEQFVLKSVFMENMIYVGQGEKYSLSHPYWMEYLRQIIDCPSRFAITLAGRQVGKTMMCGAEACTEAASEPNYTVLYGTVDNNKLKNFSNQKLNTIIRETPFIRRAMLKGRVNKEIVDNVLDKRFSNGSMVMVRNAKLEQNLRSPTTDSLKFDEIQDMLYDTIYFGIKTMFTSPHKLLRLYGTPKSFDNIIQQYFDLSTQNEWLIPCQHCTMISSVAGATVKQHWWNCIGMKNVTRQGLVCSRCGKPINVRDGNWYRMYPGKEYEGFRIPEPISPFCDFDDLMKEIEDPHIPLASKMNEIFGLSFEHADRWMTETDIKKACSQDRLYENRSDLPPELEYLVRNGFVVAGLDWSLNTDRGAETVLFICALSRTNALKPIFGMKLPKNLDWNDQVKYIGKKLIEFDVNLLAADFGAAGHRNIDLANAIGSKKVVEILWGNVTKDPGVFHEKVRRLSIDRTMAFSDYKADMQKKHVELCRWEDFVPFAKDFTVVTMETNKMGRLKYDHPMGTFDDAAHAMIYAGIARKICLNEPIVHLIAHADEE